MGRNGRVDSVRASRDGHEFHEAWTARKALELLDPKSDLYAIAVEGLSPADQAGADEASAEVADLTLYYGKRSNFEDAKRTTVAQFKYSIASQDNDFCASDAKKTIEKFGKAYRSFKKQYRAKPVEAKLYFQIFTNQPVSTSLLKAISSVADGRQAEGKVKRQVEQFVTASGLAGKPRVLKAFARKVEIIGRSGSLRQIKNELATQLVDWSAGSDFFARSGLGDLRQLVRDKAGSRGTDQNLIKQTDVLDALSVPAREDLLPCRASLVPPGDIVERTQLQDAISVVNKLTKPLLVHASGGTGKTVFLSSLASALREDHEVVFFDCFGGGAYRSPEDARHLPRKGLVHIVNTLAVRGLCDLILPGGHETDSLLRTFRRRLEQSIRTIPGHKLALFIDAIDNAAYAANQAGDDCFPVKLLGALDFEPIEGLKVVVSCRSEKERKPRICAKLEEFELKPFTRDETAKFLSARLENVSATEINLAQARSAGNPRVLDYLVQSERNLLKSSETDKSLEVDDLIQRRIDEALATTRKRGCEEHQLSAFLAGLAVLPPPVPVDEYAAALGMESAAVESFASDLSPLLERTSLGLIFRDEPTETLVLERYATSSDTLRFLADNLLARQTESVYAARALPRLLHELDDSEHLFSLAFSERMPSAITSVVGKRDIRYARLKTATRHAALKTDYNHLLRLLVELSTIAKTDQRGAHYIAEHADLAVVAKDSDALRRLFETKTRWAGTRHARLALVNLLSGDSGEAAHHSTANDEWIDYFLRTLQQRNSNDPEPDQADFATSIFYQLSEISEKKGPYRLTKFRDWYAFGVAKIVLRYAHLANQLEKLPGKRISDFLNSFSNVGSLAAAVSHCPLSASDRKSLCIKLAKLCEEKSDYDPASRPPSRENSELEDGLRKSATIALSFGLKAMAKSILFRTTHERPQIWAFQGVPNSIDEVFGFIFRVALLAAAERSAVHEKDILPQELAIALSHISETTRGPNFRAEASAAIADLPHKSQSVSDDPSDGSLNAVSYDERQRFERFLESSLKRLHILTQSLSEALAASPETLDESFTKLVAAWEEARKRDDRTRSKNIDYFFQFLGLKAVLLILWSRSELGPQALRQMLEVFHAQVFRVTDLINIVSTFSQRPPLHELAGEQAVKARETIEKEDDAAYRATLFGQLGRAMLPACHDEASVYFRNGLEQVDAIDSADYSFTNELLFLGTGTTGDELEEKEFHVLSNICELNMASEPKKFYWGAYGRCMSRIAGLRGLAKLSRWDDRGQIGLDTTLLPYLTGLLEARKIDAEEAAGLYQLITPADYYSDETTRFFKALSSLGKLKVETISALLTQFERDNPEIASKEALTTLNQILEENLDTAHDLKEHFQVLRDRYKAAREGLDTGYTRFIGTKNSIRADEIYKEEREEVDRIAESADPTDLASIQEAVNDFNALSGFGYKLKDDFFSKLRTEVPFNKRKQYLQNIAKLEHLNFFWKLAELKFSREAWCGTSTALENTYKALAKPLICGHLDDLVDGERLSGSCVKEVSEITGHSVPEIALELVKKLCRPDNDITGSIWLAFASLVCQGAEVGEARKALSRLLQSDSVRIANDVIDGPYTTGCYPANDFTEVAAGLVWRRLGSPYAVERWRAAHCLRRFAKFGHWEIIDTLLAGFQTTTAGPFQAPELKFFYLHARLWLLIAVARIALDHPAQIARYNGMLLSVITETELPHVLMQHFAAKAILACVDRGEMSLQPEEMKLARQVDKSPYERLRGEIREDEDFYQGRPDSVPRPSFRFSLNHDFAKLDVNTLSLVFGKGCWEVEDMMSSVVEKIEPTMTSMYDDGGRDSPRGSFHEMTSSFQHYGQQLGWHALLISATKLLAACPVTDDSSYENPWEYWLKYYQLTREDGLWLSDGTDRDPEDCCVKLLESKGETIALSSVQKHFKELLALDTDLGVTKELTVYGNWLSADSVRIKISSALAPGLQATELVEKLSKENPKRVWLPVLQDDQHGGFRPDFKKEYTPWIVDPAGESYLDKHDPYGVSVANFRPYLAPEYSDFFQLTKQDPFGRTWKDNQGRLSYRTEAWGSDSEYLESGSSPGVRLRLNGNLTKRILEQTDLDLIILIHLQRSEKESPSSTGRSWHSVGVVRISRLMKAEYFKGPTNDLHESGW